MKKSLLLSAALSWLIPICALAHSDETVKKADQAADYVEEAAETTGAFFKKNWDGLKDYSADKSDDFQKAMKSAGRKIRIKANDLLDESDEIPEKAADAFDDAWENFKEQLSKVDDAAENGWDATRENVREAWDELKDAYEDLVD